MHDLDRGVDGRTLETLRFGPVEIAFDETVLRPRPWTLAQSTWAAELGPGPLLELGCGAGRIGLAAAVLTGGELVQVDRNPDACRLAGANADAAGVAHRVTQRCGDVGSVLNPGERFVVVLADPPYVPSRAVAALPDDPVVAIDGGLDGLDLVRAFTVVAARHLADGAAVLLQVGGDAQVDAVEAWVGRPGTPDLAVVERRTFGPDRALALLRPA